MELVMSFRLFLSYDCSSGNNGVASARIASAGVALAASARVNGFYNSSFFNYSVLVISSSFLRTTASNHRGSEGNNCEVN